jgi:hypothetical protein
MLVQFSESLKNTGKNKAGCYICITLVDLIKGTTTQYADFFVSRNFVTIEPIEMFSGDSIS